MAKRYTLIALLIILNIYCFILININDTSSKIIVIDVDQGDSILIKDNNRYGLIDTGKGSFLVNEISKFLPILKKDLDFIILTHPDSDHIEGLLKLLDLYKLKSVYITKSIKTNDLTLALFKKIKENNINLYYLNDSNDFYINNLTFNVFHPTKNTPLLDSNDLSIGIEISNNKCSIYTAGDLSSKYEVESLNKLKDLNIEILKVGHHGSKTSSSFEFIERLKPRAAIISSGKNNRYNHPDFEVISTLLKNNVKILNTQFDKSIEIILNSDYLSLKYSNNYLTYSCN